MAITPMEQFETKPLIAAPFHLGGYPIYFTNEALWMCIVVGATTLFMLVALRKRELVPSRMQSMAEMSYEFVANMVNLAAGEDGLAFFPFIFTLFLFIAVSNFFGLIPGSFTVTSQIAVTFELTALVILTVIVTGFVKHGLGFFRLFTPDAPLGILLFLAPLEFISFCARPMSLSMRLFANMLAGHTMLKVMAAFVVALGAAAGALKFLSIAPMLLIIGLTALEFLVAFLQAYVFAILSCIYLNEALHLHDSH
jgi:F-type H+-transporting ATPase subunit a